MQHPVHRARPPRTPGASLAAHAPATGVVPVQVQLVRRGGRQGADVQPHKGALGQATFLFEVQCIRVPRL